MNVDEVAAGVRQVIADAERYKRERDEAVHVIRELREMADRHDCGECGGFLSCELNFVPTADKFLARIEQADKAVPHA